VKLVRRSSRSCEELGREVGRQPNAADGASDGRSASGRLIWGKSAADADRPSGDGPQSRRREGRGGRRRSPEAFWQQIADMRPVRGPRDAVTQLKPYADLRLARRKRAPRSTQRRGSTARQAPRRTRGRCLLTSGRRGRVPRRDAHTQRMFEAKRRTDSSSSA
jgi:hypothetical protein